GAAAETGAGFGRAIGEHRDVARRFFEAGEFERRVTLRGLARISRKRLPVAGAEVVDDSAAPRGGLDDDEAPRLAQPARGGQAGDFDRPVDRAGRQWLAAETAHVAAPDEEVVQALSERIVKYRRRRAAHRGFSRRGLRAPPHARVRRRPR